jgi:hypothetical protein
MTILVEGIGLILEWLGHQTAQRDRADDAVKAVLLAVNETQAYLIDRKNGSQSREREVALARLWTEAAVAIRRSDADFAQLLQMKAEFWTNPRAWPEQTLKELAIHIDAVAGRARSLLGGAI